MILWRNVRACSRVLSTPAARSLSGCQQGSAQDASLSHLVLLADATSERRTRPGEVASDEGKTWVHPDVVLKPIAGKGRGMVLTAPLPAGTLVVRELPIALTKKKGSLLPKAVVRAIKLAKEEDGDSGDASSPGGGGSGGWAARELSLLSPSRSSVSHHGGGGGGGGGAGSIDHASLVCKVNATRRENVDEFARLPQSGSKKKVSGCPLLLGSTGGASNDESSAGGGGSNHSMSTSTGNNQVSSSSSSSGPPASSSSSHLQVAGLLPSSKRRSPGGTCLPVRRSLINHSCSANAATLHLPSGYVYVRTLRDLREGDELTVEYLAGLHLMSPPHDRRAMLQGAWGFQCNCSRCTGIIAANTVAATSATVAADEEESGGSGGGGDSLHHQQDSFHHQQQAKKGGGDPLDVSPTRGWLMSAGEVMGAVSRGSGGLGITPPGAGEALEWLAKRQREHAKGKPSYTEFGVLAALAQFHVSQAYALAAAAAAGDTATESSSSSTTSLTDEKEEEEEEEKKRAKALQGHVFGARRALAAQGPILDLAFVDNPNHPARIPPLLARALVALSEQEGQAREDREEEERGGSGDAEEKANGGGKDTEEYEEEQQQQWLDDRRSTSSRRRRTRGEAAAEVTARALVSEALRVHRVAFGGGLELFKARYGHGYGGGSSGSGSSGSGGHNDGHAGCCSDELEGLLQLLK